ncbi:LuxR C-terminal-related transcriptional regulator [Knoellia sp. 3-2P3]|uniref:LuxR C-terminal-related transcriptional regulator n=1 Tax=unclassified Knoellia TaxID=2618719 RepID=UPI0023DB3AF0|nr:LuxR C-terminal-related transcriptional regulator [Knoellia sp. 3-2P3]MDF2092224.1 LuxR C-terminal-related transcriptional regulator [Knoellia sp. 3-2P3]
MAVLATKIHPPAPRRDLVPRPRLAQRLSPGERPRLVLVSAPAGFGKTTLLCQWLAEADDAPRVAWLSLDATDNDPRRFLENVVAALQVQGRLPEAAELVATGAEAPVEAVLTAVVNDLDLQPGRTLLVLDDYHVIEAPEVHRAVTFLLDHLPPQAGLAVATRADPQLPLPRLRARGELVELRASELRFTTDEAGVFLADVMGLHLDGAQVAALEARTEGWVAGLQLAGLSLRGLDDTTEFVEAFTGSHRFVLDYLVEEVLRHQAEPVREFLLDTAVLSQLTGSLCDALTGGHDGSSMLESLERANLFVVALDDDRQWYRYHQLFADALRARLAAERPGHVAVLHRAAGEWYAAHGLPEDAVRHALASGDAGYAADLVEAALPDLRRQRRDRVLREWLTALPGEVVRSRPLLGTYLAWTRLVAGDLDGVEVALGEAELALVASPPAAATGASVATMEELRTLPATMAIFRASAAQARGDSDATQRHARSALELAGPEDHMARCGALGFLGLAAWGRGDLEEAVDTFSAAVQSMGAAGDVADQLGSTVVLASMWVARGRPVEARRLLERALATAGRHRGAALATLGDLHVGLADVLIEQGELDAAAEHLRAAKELGESSSLLENRHRWYVAMARLRCAQGEFEAAVELLAEAEPLFLPGFFPDLRPIPAQRARVRIAQGPLADAWEWARDHQVQQVIEPSYLDEYDQLTLVRLLVARHRADGDQDSLHEAAQRLDRLVPPATSGGRGGSLVEIGLVQALVADARGDRAAALAHLGPALEAGVPAGYVRLFLDEGEPMTRLLEAAERMPTTGDHARRLAAAAYREPAVGPGDAKTEGLSDREMEVLRLLATTLSGPEIAGQLFVSVNTLRTHTKHIFTKLDVNTRRAAVSRAAELGLL